MTTRIESVEDGIRVTGEMTVYTASQIKQPLLDAIADGAANVQLDLSGVSEFDTAGVQLLLLIHREALLSWAESSARDAKPHRPRSTHVVRCPWAADGRFEYNLEGRP